MTTITIPEELKEFVKKSMAERRDFHASEVNRLSKILIDSPDHVYASEWQYLKDSHLKRLELCRESLEYLS